MKKSVYLLTAAVFALSGCGNHGESGKGATQVVAKVNDSEITVHQLNLAVSKLGKLDQSQFKSASEKVLQQLIDLELLKQKSIEDKLDRDPNVLQVLEAAKQQVLAQAYMQKVAAKQSAPTESEITTFFNQHPELFTERNIYLIHEFQIKDGNKHVSEIETGINSAKSAEEVVSWLKQNNYQFNLNASKRAAEQLPLEIAKKLNTLKTSDSLLVNAPDGLTILFLTKSERQPVELDKAKPVIKQFLINAGQQTLIKNEVAALRKDAKIQLMGEFSGTATDSAQTQPSPAPTPVAEPKSDNNKAIEKGLSGLK